MQGVRSLETPGRHGSTSRVLNLHRRHELRGRDSHHGTRRFFNDPMLNRAMIIKHRLRSDEACMMPRARKIVTKVVFPFTSTDLRAGGGGGRSLSVRPATGRRWQS